MSDMRRTRSAALVYVSPLARAVEYAQDTSGALLRDYLALSVRDSLWSIQTEAVDFMRRRESEQGRGGMLCDEMGLGKTKDALTLVLERNQESARLSQRRFNGATLVVCRGILIKNWLCEVRQLPRDAFQYAVLTTASRHHGTDPLYFARCCDLVFTTYSSVTAAYRRSLSRTEAEDDDDSLYRALFNTTWRRVVADEAHFFAVATTERAQAMFHLRADYNWILTGTPIQNSHRDLVTHLRFCGIAGVTDTVAHLKRLLSEVMLRRTRATLATLGGSNLPVFRSVTRRVTHVSLSPAEQALYFLYAKYALLRNSEQQRVALRSTQMIQMLRQLCLAPSLVDALVVPCGLRVMGQANEPAAVSARRGGRAHKLSAGLTLAEYFTRWHTEPLQITYTGEDSEAVLQWRPQFAFRDSAERRLYKVMCREFETVSGRWAGTPVMAERYSQVPVERVKEMARHIVHHTLRLDMPSSKQAAILRYIAQTPRGEKVIVFSNYVDFLAGMDHWLAEAGVRAVLVTGVTNKKEMNDSLLAEFECDAEIKVLLITLTLGGEGLNITCANHVVIADPWWNPFILEQAENRVQRASQSKDVSIVYFIARHTIEVPMYRYLGEKKSELPEVLSHGDAECDEFLRTLIFDYKVRVKRV